MFTSSCILLSMVGGVLAGNGLSRSPARFPEPSASPHALPVPEWTAPVMKWLKDKGGSQEAETFRQAFEDGDADAIDAPLNVLSITALHYTSLFGAPDIATLLLKNRANVNAEDFFGSTPLHHASFQGNNEVIPVLLKNGAIVNAKNKNGQTPLNLASLKGAPDIVTLLLNKGANVNAEDFYGDTPLHHASLARKNEVVVQVLLDNGADVNAKNKKGQTPLSVAKSEGNLDIVTLLLDTLAKHAEPKKNLRMAKLKKNHETLDCLICHEEVKCTDEELRLCTECESNNGIFHKDCIQRWFEVQKKNDCPSCKRQGTIF